MTLSVQEQAVVSLINGYRTSTGAQPLVISQTLSQAATFLAQDMATTGVLSHTDSLGRDFVTRMADCGVTGLFVGENIAAGFTTPQAVFNAWQASPEHNANMLNRNFSQVGIAEVNGYWVTDFAGGQSFASPPVTQQQAPTTPQVIPQTGPLAQPSGAGGGVPPVTTPALPVIPPQVAPSSFTGSASAGPGSAVNSASAGAGPGVASSQLSSSSR